MTANPGDSAFVRACRGQPVPHTPVWFMRQAGRSLPEYRAVRADIPMLEACARPDTVVELTLQPVRRYGVDAAIIFSDIVVPLRAVGIDLDIVSGTGPVIADPIRDESGVRRLRPLDPADVAFVADSVRMLVGELGATPLIGFAGAPFTLASYLVEGGPSRDLTRTKALMYGDEGTWTSLMGALASIAGAHLRVQVDAGVSAVQLFDSWVGALSAEDYERYVLPYSSHALAQVSDVPRIHFGVGTGELLSLMADAGGDVVGVDWRIPLDEANHRIGGRAALQGNLDPAACFAPWGVVASRTRAVLGAGASARGHVFNLGHGVLPATDPDVLARIVDLVHTETARSD